MTSTAPIGEHLAARILSCPGLPTLPAVALQVLDLCDQDDVDLAAIAAVVSHDPAIAARLLRQANSASFATRGRVSSLTRAVGLLGTNATLGVVLSFSLVGDRRRHDASGFDHPAFWKRAVFSALGGRALGRAVDHDLDDAFLACLLQDIGMLAMNAVFPAEYGRACLAADSDHEALPAIEAERFGVDHVQVGGLLIQRWSLPERLQEALRRSHGPASLPPGPGRLALHQAVLLSGRLADAWTSARPPEVIRAALGVAADLLGLTPEIVSAALQRMAAAVPEASTDFDLDLGGPDRVQAVLVEAQRLLKARRPAAALEPGPVPFLPIDAFQRITGEQVDQASRAGRPAALLAIRAAAAGSPEAAAQARILQTSLRQADALGRDDGHYLALLIDTPAGAALRVLERLRTRLVAAGLDGAVGMACLPDPAHESSSQLVAAARAALDAAPGRSPP